MVDYSGYGGLMVDKKWHPMIAHEVPFVLEMVAGIGLEPMTKGL